jgi:hypothetical protein
MHKADVLLATRCNGAVDDRQHDRCIACDGGVQDLSTGGVVEADNRKVLEVKPSGIKKVAPVVHEAVDDGAAGQLGANRMRRILTGSASRALLTT